MRHTPRFRFLRLTATVVAALGLVLGNTPVATAQHTGAQESAVQQPPAQESQENNDATSETTPVTTAADTAETSGNTASDAKEPAPAPAQVPRSPFRNAGGPTPGSPTLGLVVGIESDGTADFDADNEAGNDSNAKNGIVRVNDTVTYRVDYNVNAAPAEDAVITLTLPKGMEIISVPGVCLAGSTLEPPTAGIPNLPLSANSINELNEQTLTCKLGRKDPAGTITLPVTAKVLNLVHQGQKLKPVRAEFGAAGVQAVSVAEKDLPAVTASARLKWDISKNGVQERDDSGYKYGPATEPCPWDRNRVCKRTGYTVLLSAPNGGKGAMPAIGDIVLKDDLTFRSLYSLTEEQYAKLEADPDKYGSRAYLSDNYYAVPGNKVGTRVNGVNLTDKNSVRDAGTMTLDNTLKAEAVTMTITNADMSLRTYPNVVSRPPGTPVPGNKAYAVSQSFDVFTPVDTITEVGEKNGSTWTLKTVNKFKDLQLQGFTPTDRQTISDQYTGNDYRTTTPDVNLGARFNKAFTGVPGEERNMLPNEFSPGYGARGEGPPGGATLRSGGITVAPTQDVLSQLEVSGSSPELPGDIAVILCDSWDSSRLNLHSRDVPISAHNGINLQSLPSGGAPVWVSGYNNVLDGGKARWAREASEVPAIKVQYSAVGGGSGEASECGEAQGPWFDDPAAVPGNDTSKLAEGIYTGVARVRVHTVLPRPVDNSAIVGTGVRMAVSINHKVVDSQRESGDILPNWASIKAVPGKSLDLNETLADSAGWTRSAYNPERHSGEAGDRLILADAQVRVDKQVRKGDSGPFSDVPPQVSGGDAGGANQTPADRVDYQIVPTLTSGALTRGILRDVWVEDCLPSSQMYISATVEPTVVSDTTPGDAKRSACQAGETYIRWEFPKHEVNTTIDPIILTTEVSPLASTGVYNNVVKVWAERDASTEKDRTNDAQVQVSNIEGIRLQKEALTPVVQVNRPNQNREEYNKWRVRLLNTLPPTQSAAVSNPDIIDVLPKNGVAGTSYQGEMFFVSATVTKGSKPGQDVRILYSKSENVQLDPQDPSNAAGGTTTWCDAAEGGSPVIGSGECPDVHGQVTAIRVQRPGAYTTGESIEFEVATVGVDNAGGDTYVNRVYARAAGLQLPVGPIARPETVVESSIGDYTWWDNNRNGLQDDIDGTPEPAAPNIPVHLEGVDDLGNPVSLDTTTDTSGLYSFPRLRSSDDAGYTVTFNKDSGRALTFTKKTAGDQDKDSNADPATGAAEAVVLAKDTRNTTIDAGFVAMGSLVIAKNLEGPGADSFAPGKELEFRVVCTLAGTQVREETVNLAVEKGKKQLRSAALTDIPVGASCEVTETGTAAADPNAGGGQPQVTTVIGLDAATGMGAEMTAMFTNRYSAGVVKLIKRLDGEAKDTATAKQFGFEVTCQLPDAQATLVKKNVSITGEGETVVTGDDGQPLQLPVGTKCFATETDNGGATNTTIDHHDVDTGVQVVANTEDQPAELAITATNTFITPRAEFKISKTLVDNGSTGRDTFGINYECSAEGRAVGSDDVVPAEGKVDVQAGQEVVVGRFPIGTTCKITSEDKLDVSRDGYTLNAEYGDEVVVAAPSVSIPVTNTYVREVSTFTVVKKLAGEVPEAAKNTTFQVRYTCGAETGVLDVPGTGEPVTGPQIPSTTECSLEELPDETKYEGYTWQGERFDGNRFVIGPPGTVTNVELTNTYRRDRSKFILRKGFEGDDITTVDTQKKYIVNYACGDITGSLELPGNGAPVNGPDIPTYVECRLEEDIATAARDGYTVEPRINHPRFTMTEDDGIFEVDVTNVYTRDKSYFNVVKELAGDGIDELRDRTFTVNYECGNQHGSLEVKADGTPVQGPAVPTGTECTLEEDVRTASHAGYSVQPEFDKPRFTVGAKDSVTPVKLTNTYTRDKGSFSIAKTVAGDDADAVRDRTFTFAYTCGDTTGTLQVKGDGQPVQGPQIPTGTECQIREEAADREGYSVNARINTPDFRITDKDSVVAVQATNTYSRDHGSFEVVKELAGDDTAALGDKTFTVNYVCGDQRGSLEVKGDGTPVQGPQIPTGTQCVLEEDAASAARDNYSVAAQFDRPSFTVTDKDAVTKVKLTNTYARHKGGFTLSKTVTGNAAARATGEVTFTYTCEGLNNEAKTVKVAPGAVVSVSDVPTGTCVVEENDAPVEATDYTTTLSVDGGAPVPGRRVEFEVTEGKTIAVAATNEYTQHTGSFEIVKKIEIEEAKRAELADRTFRFDYTCGETTGVLEVRGDGAAVKGPQLPTGTKCKVEEAASSAQVEGYSLTAPAASEFTIEGKDSVHRVEATNSYTKDTGTFAIEKVVKGNADAAKDTFRFDYTCGDAAGSLEVRGDGTATDGPQLPVGTQCKVTEDVKAAERDGYSLNAASPMEFVIEKKDQKVQLKATNSYTAEDPKPLRPTPPTSTTPSSAPSTSSTPSSTSEAKPSTSRAPHTPQIPRTSHTPNAAETPAATGTSTSAPMPGQEHKPGQPKQRSLAKTGVSGTLVGMAALAILAMLAGAGVIIMARRQR